MSDNQKAPNCSRTCVPSIFSDISTTLIKMVFELEEFSVSLPVDISPICDDRE